MNKKVISSALLLVAVMAWSLVLYAPASPMVFAWGAFFGIALSGIAVMAGVRP